MARVFTITAEFLRGLTVGELADFHFNEIAIHDAGSPKRSVTQAERLMSAEIDRRALTEEQLCQAWNELAAMADAEPSRVHSIEELTARYVRN